MREWGKKGVLGSINIEEEDFKGLGDKLYVGEGEGGLKQDSQISVRVWTSRWDRRPGSSHRWHKAMPREDRSSACILMASPEFLPSPPIRRVSEKDSDWLAWVMCSPP